MGVRKSSKLGDDAQVSEDSYTPGETENKLAIPSSLATDSDDQRQIRRKINLVLEQKGGQMDSITAIYEVLRICQNYDLRDNINGWSYRVLP